MLVSMQLIFIQIWIIFIVKIKKTVLDFNPKYTINCYYGQNYSRKKKAFIET